MNILKKKKNSRGCREATYYRNKNGKIQGIDKNVIKYFSSLKNMLSWQTF